MATLSAAFAVCVSGSIGFVGLVVPHMMRMPASALVGALFLVGCDTLGRCVMSPQEVRVGIMTALVGAPYFLYLLRQTQRKGGLS